MNELYISDIKKIYANYLNNNSIHYQKLIVYAVLSLITKVLNSNGYNKYIFVTVRCRSPPERFEVKSNFSGGFYYGRR